MIHDSASTPDTCISISESKKKINTLPVCGDVFANHELCDNEMNTATGKYPASRLSLGATREWRSRELLSGSLLAAVRTLLSNLRPPKRACSQANR